jgi:hypothetical protein
MSTSSSSSSRSSSSGRVWGVDSDGDAQPTMRCVCVVECTTQAYKGPGASYCGKACQKSVWWRHKDKCTVNLCGGEAQRVWE